jgi:hypothetical protein
MAKLFKALKAVIIKMDDLAQSFYSSIIQLRLYSSSPEEKRHTF